MKWGYPEFVTPEYRNERYAGVPTSLLPLLAFVGVPHVTYMQRIEAFRASGGVKASRIQVYVWSPANRSVVF